MTNIEYIRSLNEKELFEFLYEINLDRCFARHEETVGNIDLVKKHLLRG